MAKGAQPHAPDSLGWVERTAPTLSRRTAKLTSKWRLERRVAPDEVAPYPARTTALIDGGSTMLVIVQLVGAVLVLAPFAAHQVGQDRLPSPRDQ